MCPKYFVIQYTTIKASIQTRKQLKFKRLISRFLWRVVEVYITVTDIRMWYEINNLYCIIGEHPPKKF